MIKSFFWISLVILIHSQYAVSVLRSIDELDDRKVRHLIKQVSTDIFVTIRGRESVQKGLKQDRRLWVKRVNIVDQTNEIKVDEFLNRVGQLLYHNPQRKLVGWKHEIDTTGDRAANKVTVVWKTEEFEEDVVAIFRSRLQPNSPWRLWNIEFHGPHNTAPPKFDDYTGRGSSASHS
ncbi:uncharacterized protein MELLADRAFT_123219 [Melampsora larici-populina 98AG31]|uniref:Secreted protein n=1 Tax=Melampsora larici-populina (strain 98AG31 / pathotype 3-4-7) TaxID=747676 RepID=F4R895_MELLP|nr:uncharacterized protein MELLADRAFT_123219 [Melampsora larici-populina 98AG31]EGG11454.1 secreted protein [Melampsora larici-populina 98AG31]